MRSLSSRLRLQRSGVQLLAPTSDVVHNSLYPWTINDGALWAGRGMNRTTRIGMAARWWRLRAVIAPEVIRADNRAYPDVDTTQWYRPPLDTSRYSTFASPWSKYPFVIDMPVRFGLEPLATVVAGQSSVWYESGRVAAGVGTENQWWGPGLRDALVFTNTAAGFPHAFARTARPLRTAVGDVEARWLVGVLRESDYFDRDSTNRFRSIAAAAVTLSPAFDRDLTLGLARAVYARAPHAETALLRPLDVVQPTRRPNARSLDDTTFSGGRDQIMSVFARWVFPDAGAEVYGELGRSEFPGSLRDFLVDPTHSMGYLLGGQWTRPWTAVGAEWRAQAELIFIERSSSYRYRPTTSWYASRASPQGYTEQGQPLGSGLGPGSSHQWLAADLVADRWSGGAFVGRYRRNADWNGGGTIYPLGTGWCEWDVTLYPGARGGVRLRGLGVVSGQIFFANRLNYLFQNNSGCPRGGHMLDVRSSTWQLTVTPLARW